MSKIIVEKEKTYQEFIFSSTDLDFCTKTLAHPNVGFESSPAWLKEHIYQLLDEKTRENQRKWCNRLGRGFRKRSGKREGGRCEKDILKHPNWSNKWFFLLKRNAAMAVKRQKDITRLRNWVRDIQNQTRRLLCLRKHHFTFLKNRINKSKYFLNLRTWKVVERCENWTENGQCNWAIIQTMRIHL